MSDDGFEKLDFFHFYLKARPEFLLREIWKNLKVHILNMVIKSISKLILAVSWKQHDGELPRVGISE